MKNHKPSTDEMFIHRYTRSQALADGALVDVSQMAQEAGFRLHVAMTSAAWADAVAWTDDDTRRQTPQDESGRLWDVLWMGRIAAQRAGGNSVVTVRLHRVPRDGRDKLPRLTALKMVMCHGDEGEPVLTIMLPAED
jgi:hypothetical protein